MSLLEELNQSELITLVQNLRDVNQKAYEILVHLCKECSEDNFGSCENDCKINDLKDIFQIPRKETEESK